LADRRKGGSTQLLQPDRHWPPAFRKAFKRVYSPSQPAWDGAWTLVLLSQLEAGKRKAVREELEWQGFGVMAPNLPGLPTGRPCRPGGHVA
jgi:DNA-binding transcriptional regulator PaaX